MKLYQQFAQTFAALTHCRNADTLNDWEEKHEERLEELCKTYMPSGSGFDAGTTFDDIASKPERLVFNTAFHHMNDVGTYDGWTHHTVIITASLVHGFTLRITGRDKNDIKSFLAEEFHMILDQTL
jgi:hypothetical protein